MAGFSGPSLLVALSVGCFCVCVGSDLCTTGFDKHPYSYSTTYCTYGCCGTYPNEYCCSTSTGMIIGVIFAAVAGICLLIAVICCCIKKPGLAGRMMSNRGAQNRQGNNLTVVYTGASGQYPSNAFNPTMGAQTGGPAYPGNAFNPHIGAQYPSHVYSKPVDIRGEMPPPYPPADAPPPAYPGYDYADPVYQPVNPATDSRHPFSNPAYDNNLNHKLE